MAKVTFEMEIEPEEVAQAVDALKDIVEAFAFPEYVIQYKVADTMHTTCGGAARGSVNPPAVELDVDTRAFLESLCGTACEPLSFEEAENYPPLSDEEPPTTGDIVEVCGIEYVVYSSDIEGRLELVPRDELIDEEDHPLC